MYFFLCIVLLFHTVLGVYDPRIEFRDGLVFQDMSSCKQLISEERAYQIYEKNETNMIILEGTSLIGRSGNHFLDISQHLSMGFCCKGIVELPEEDKILPSLNGSFRSDKRFFDFSDADVPEEFEYLSKNQEICPKNIVFKDSIGGILLSLPQVDKDLRLCTSRVYLRGCETAYLGDIANTNTCKIENSIPDTNYDKKCREPRKSNIVGTESLVVHIRSGDIFRPGSNHFEFGQPPLQYYIDSINSQVWSSVTIITYARIDSLVNPIFSALEDLNCQGYLGENVKTYKNRDWNLDFRDMVCADALVMSKSSAHHMTLALTKARKLFVPSTCGGKLGRKRDYFPLNTNLMYSELKDVSIYGIEWGDSEYSVYKKWEPSFKQYQEMLQFKDMTIKKCDKYF